jgi:dihydrolipoamide dehydrogenase
MSKENIDAQLVVLGSGPGGYTAAFRAADLGIKVVLIEKYSTLGGVCLNVGCIPSKALLHSAKVIDEAAHISNAGVTFGEPEIDLDKLRGYKDGVVSKLTTGLAGMAKMRKVQVVQGYGKFTGANTIEVVSEDASQTVNFESCIIAAGSRIVALPFLPDDPRILNSTTALELEDVPGSMLCLGGGIIGLEMANVYNALGTKISIVELLDKLITVGVKDFVAPLMKIHKKR